MMGYNGMSCICKGVWWVCLRKPFFSPMGNPPFGCSTVYIGNMCFILWDRFSRKSKRSKRMRWAIRTGTLLKDSNGVGGISSTNQYQWDYTPTKKGNWPSTIWIYLMNNGFILLGISMDYRMNSLRVDFLTVGFSWELPGELTNLNLSGFFLGLTERGIFAVKHGRFLGQNISCTSKYVDFNTTWQCLIWHPAVKGSLLAGHRCLWKWPFGSMIYPAMMHMLVSKTRSDMIRFPKNVFWSFF